MFDQLFSDTIQKEVRIMLMRISAIKSLTYKGLAKEIGISGGTIERFLGKGIDVRKQTLTKMLEYIELKRGEIGL